MTKPESMLNRLIDAAAERLAQDPRIPDSSRTAFRQTAVAVMQAQWSVSFGGERIRLWTAKTPAVERQARRDRVLAALRAGEAPEAIARREGLAPRYVVKLRRLHLSGPEKVQAQG